MNSDQLSPPIAWWRVPQMWLVVGGPLVVVLACMVTITLAVMYPDPVLNKSAYERDLKALSGLEGKEKMEVLITLQPAGQARNHAASPLVVEPK